MNNVERNAAIKTTVAASFAPILRELNAIQVNDFTYAIPVVVDGEQRYAEVTLTAKSNKDTKTAAAYDPAVKVAEWQDAKAESASKKAEQNAAKAAKITRDTAKRAAADAAKKAKEA